MNENKILVSDLSPYPKICVQEVNLKYAQILSFDFAGPNSEMTTSLTYAYQNWIFNSEFSYIADTIARISIVEMHHFDMLGQLILLLGGNPKYQISYQNRLFPWNAGNVNYNQNLKQCLINNIKGEQEAFENYMKQMQIIQDKNISIVLGRIALDEKIHIDIFTKFLSQI